VISKITLQPSGTDVYLPTQITARHDANSTYPVSLGLGYPAYEDQVTTLTYDAVGNLLTTTRRENASLSWTTQLGRIRQIRATATALCNRSGQRHGSSPLASHNGWRSAGTASAG
jgi:YD repeat-containing protein